jgi:hypothetical protein
MIDSLAYFGHFIPIILILVLIFKKNRKEELPPFFENQQWLCKDVLYVFAFISLFKLFATVLALNRILSIIVIMSIGSVLLLIGSALFAISFRRERAWGHILIINY